MKIYPSSELLIAETRSSKQWVDSGTAAQILSPVQTTLLFFCQLRQSLCQIIWFWLLKSCVLTKNMSDYTLLPNHSLLAVFNNVLAVINSAGLDGDITSALSCHDQKIPPKRKRTWQWTQIWIAWRGLSKRTEVKIVFTLLFTVAEISWKRADTHGLFVSACLKACIMALLCSYGPVSHVTELIVDDIIVF